MMQRLRHFAAGDFWKMRLRAICCLFVFAAVFSADGRQAEAAEVVVSDWWDLETKFQSSPNNTIFKLGADIHDSFGGSLSVPAGTSYTLDLAGHLLNIVTSTGAAIEVPDSSSLAIVDSVGGGTLIADASGSNGAAGIGGASEKNGGAITILSGTVIAKGGADGAGIGSGSCTFICAVPTGPITIGGGIVEATGGLNGAGIGGGLEGAGGTITINGGSITANGGYEAAGIGGGSMGAGGTIVIHDGLLNVTGGDYASGIGGGSTEGWGNITINGGTLTVAGGAMGAGIGGGAYDFGGMITINGGDVTTTGRAMDIEYGTYGGAGIGGGGFGNDVGSVTITGGTVRATGAVNAAAIGGGTDAGGAVVNIHGGTIILSGPGGNKGTLIGAGTALTYEPGDFGSLSNAGTITVSEGGKLWIPPGETFTNSGTVNGAGAIEIDGAVINTGTINTDHRSGHIYVLSFDLNGAGGTAPSDITLYAPTLSDAGETLPEPIRTGYAFVGWYTAASGGTKVTETDTISGDMTLYAHWTINSYTVTFDPNGGSGPTSPVTVEHGGLLTEPTEPTRTGFTFVGWFTDPADAMSEWDFDEDTVNGNMTLYAHWTINSYTVTFDPNGGGGPTSPVTVEHGGQLNEPTEPTRTGYTFVGWFTDPSDTTSEWDFDTDTVSGNVTLYAHWTINSYTVTFDSNGGSGPTSPVTVEHGGLLNEPTEPTRTGYTFVGWFTDPLDTTSEWDFDTDTVSGNVTLYAHWTINSYTVTFVPNGGSGPTSLVKVEHGGLLNEPTEPTRTGYTFVGWFTDPVDATSSWDFDAETVSSDMTLYAHWTINSYTVTFDPNGGSGPTSPVTVEHGDLLNEPTKPRRTGYTFVGWFTNPNDRATEWDFDNIVIADITLYAHWAAHKSTDSGHSGSASNPPAKDAETVASITLNGVTIKVRLTEEISAEGQRFVRLTFTREQLSEALASDVAEITIAVDGLGSAVKVDFPVAPFLEARRDRSDARLQLAVNGHGMLIPFDAVGKLSQEAMITATIAQASDAASIAARNGLDSVGAAQVLEKPIVFALDANGRAVEGWHNRYMLRTIALPSAVRPDRATVVRIDASGAIHFVPAMFAGDTVNMNSLHDGTYTVIQSNETFTDVQAHWARADIELLANKRIVAGRPDGRFMPDAPITRAEFASLLVRALSLREERVHRTFTDVSADDWYAEAVGTAHQAGLIRGYEDGSFRPDTTITREQIATMIARALAYAGKSPQAEEAALEAFADGSDIADWAAEAAGQLVQAGIVRGGTDTTFAPGASVSRVESVVMLKRMLQYLEFING
ncbi:InlB B-repeat-containing protein [Paenibacillaceae bacterium WGS1546]|uniref:InlB B-repeat-containing protein n=1 Tax=Cohnella sp. WGS1546 TaxID=3366810 RepID=UPI00372D41E6